MMIVNVHIVLFFISLLGLKFSFFFLSFCFRTVNGCLWGKCVCVRACSYVSYCMRARDDAGCTLFRGSRCTSAPLPVFIIVPVCSGVPTPLRPFIQKKSEGENRRWRMWKRRVQRGFSPQKGGEKQPREHTFERKKKYFSPLLGHNEECKFLN